MPPNWLRFRESRRGCEINRPLGPGVQLVIAEEIEQVAVEAVAARFGHDIDHAAGMQPVLGRQSVGLHVEFLHRIRERNGQVHVAERVVIVAAIQQEVDAVGRAAGHRILRPNRWIPGCSCCPSGRRH